MHMACSIPYENVTLCKLFYVIAQVSVRSEYYFFILVERFNNLFCV